MRLIDADALIQDLKDHKIPFNSDINEAIICAPTVDAMPFCMYEKVMQKEIEKRKALEPVKCEECKFYLGDGCDECTLLCAKSIIAILKDKRWYGDFYCAWGEKK